MRRALSSRFPGFSLRPAPVFWAFLVITPVLGAAALNTGNNALYMLLSLALGAFFASGALSRHTLGHLTAVVRPPRDVFAAAPTLVRVDVRNTSRWLPASGVVVRLDGLPGSALAPTVPCRGGGAAVDVQTVFGRRGRRRLPAVRIEVRLPLGFFVKAVTLPQEGEVVVYPRRFPAARARLAGPEREEMARGSGRRRPAGDVDVLREFRPGDDRRDIHWKQTARQQRVIVKERREHMAGARFVVFDRQITRPGDAELLQRFEDLVSEVASAAAGRLRAGDPVGLVVGSSVLPPAAGSGQVRAVLELLAVVEAAGPGEDPIPPAAAGGPVYRLAEAP